RVVAPLRLGRTSDSMMVAVIREHRDGTQPGAVWRRAPAKKGARLLGRLIEAGQNGIRIRPLGGNRAGEVGFGRLLRNPRVTPAEIISTACARTAGLVRGRHILAIQDTTSLRDEGDQRSLQLHPMIAVDAMDGALRGLVHAEYLYREGGKKANRKTRPFEEKESFRWLNATRSASALAEGGAACVTVVADREGDIYEEFALKPDNVELLIRAAQNRVLADGTHLFTCTDTLPELGREIIALPAAPGRPARNAVLALRARQVTINRPERKVAGEAAALPPRITLTFVEAREVDPPPGATPAHWRLLTTHAAHTLADARQITRFYRARWTIEQLFRTMKTKGFDIEAVRVAEGGPFENLTAATLIAAIQVLQLVRERDGDARRPLEDVFDPQDQPAIEAVCATLEGKTEKQKNPHPKGSLAYVAWVCARLGGWTGYYGKPGPIVTLQGLLRFKAIQYGWNLGRLL
ncbi:MAG TPA: IS4 family transposase, partial [Rhodopila sp.]